MMDADALAEARAIVKEVAAEHGIAVDLIYGRRRREDIMIARICAIRRIREETRLKLMAIGALFGRDHSTILSHLNRNGAGARERPSGEMSG